MQSKSIWTGISRGLMRRCPSCGAGRLFDGYLSVRPCCSACAADNAQYPSDDFPPYLTILIVGHLLVPFMLWIDRDFAFALWIETAIWLPLTALLAILVLPFMKGATVGLCWATGITRQDPVT